MRLPRRFPAYSFVMEYEGSEEHAGIAGDAGKVKHVDA
jgi:hypothetical protein